MVIGERLRERIQAAKLSYSALAKLVGVQQPTITRLVNGGQYSSTHLHKIARELGTTSAYLTGETDDPTADAPTPPELTYQQRELLEQFANLSDRARSALMVLIGELSGAAPRG